MVDIKGGGGCGGVSASFKRLKPHLSYFNTPADTRHGATPQSLLRPPVEPAGRGWGVGSVGGGGGC